MSGNVVVALCFTHVGVPWIFTRLTAPQKQQ